VIVFYISSFLKLLPFFVPVTIPRVTAYNLNFMKNLLIYKNLQSLTNLIVFTAISFVLFDIQYYMMKNLLGMENNACIPGGYLTIGNIVFAITTSILMGIFIVNFGTFIAREFKVKKIALSSLSGIGFIIGIFTVFCPVCVFPVVALGGLSFVFQFFVLYNSVIKIISIALMLISLWILEKRLGGCEVEIVNK